MIKNNDKPLFYDKSSNPDSSLSRLFTASGKIISGKVREYLFYSKTGTQEERKRNARGTQEIVIPNKIM